MNVDLYHKFKDMTHTYKITGMTCDNCVTKVKKILSKIDGITNVEINRSKEEAEITMSKHISTSELALSLQGTNYVLTDLNNEVLNGLVSETEEVSLKSYLPIFLIFGYITTITLVVELLKEQFILTNWMGNFMAGFFLVFSFFKLLDIPAFAMSYSSYDIIAKKVYAYGYIYPFIELLLGVSFLFPHLHFWSSLATIIVMSISLIGVIQSLVRKSKFQCACLGAVFKLPLSKITFFEDALMILMSVFTLLIL